jgi:hypothetical protein
MEKRSIKTGDNPQVSLTARGDLTLKGWEDLEITVKSERSSGLVLDQQGDNIAIQSDGHCTVRVPYGARIQIENIVGHATIKSLEGDLSINRIAGHLTLRSVGHTTLGEVDGHLAAKNIAGKLEVGIIEGNASVSDVQGDFVVVKSIEGNLSLNDLDGNGSARVEGNITLNLDPAPDASYQFTAEGNIFCRIPEDASVKVNIPDASSLSIKIPEVELPTPIKAPYSFGMGDQDADLTLSAEGNVAIGVLPPDWVMEDLDVEISEDLDRMADAISEQVTQQISAQVEMLEQQIEAQLANFPMMVGVAGLSAEEAERLDQRAREASERAAARAQEKIQRAQERLERKLESARRRAEMKARAAERAARDRRRRPESYEWSPPKAEPVSQPVSDDERLMVLQMLEQQLITPEQAEQLLAALEGRQV